MSGGISNSPPGTPMTRGARSSYDEGRESILERLENPDEAMVEAIQDASAEYYDADHAVTGEDWGAYVLRAIAAHLDETTDKEATDAI